MKARLGVILIALSLLSACVPLSSSPTSSLPPPSPAVTLTLQPTLTSLPPTSTPEPTLTPTATATVVTATPTPTVPEYYHGLAPTLDQFTEIDKSDIPNIIADLRSKPSLLTDGANPEPIKTTIGSNYTITVVCNGDKINCAFGASVKVMDQGQWRRLYIIEMRNKDGTRGYLTGYFYDRVELTLLGAYPSVVANPLGLTYFSIWINPFSDREQINNSYAYFLDQKPGVSDLEEKLLKTQIIPPALETTIIPMVINSHVPR